MKIISTLFLSIFLFTSFALIADEEDSCKAYTSKKQCNKEGKSKCTWLESKEICKSKEAIAKEKEAGEKNLKRPKKGSGDD